MLKNAALTWFMYCWMCTSLRKFLWYLSWVLSVVHVQRKSLLKAPVRTGSHHCIFRMADYALLRVDPDTICYVFQYRMSWICSASCITLPFTVQQSAAFNITTGLAIAQLRHNVHQCLRLAYSTSIAIWRKRQCKHSGGAVYAHWGAQNCQQCIFDINNPE